jgi:hypothetical protein
MAAKNPPILGRIHGNRLFLDSGWSFQNETKN